MQYDRDQKIVIVGAGVFGLSTALQLAREGYTNITVLDRSRPPVADGSSVDISRIIRFDYSDPVYARMAEEAFKLWKKEPEYVDSFNPSPFMLVASGAKEDGSPSYLRRAMDTLQQLRFQINPIRTAQDARDRFPAVSGLSNVLDFEGYYNENAGWADAAKAIARLRDDCLAANVSIVSGPEGTIVGADTASDGKVTSLKTKSGDTVRADLFIFATGAWSDDLLDMNNNVISTAQCVAYLRLTEAEMERYRDLPIYINLQTGFFCFPPHPDTGYLKAAIHGVGYTNQIKSNIHGKLVSSPHVDAVAQRSNFTPEDAQERLHQGITELLPEIGNRAFEKTHVCWYTDTPNGDFIMDFHPRHGNVFLATGGSGHAFKFLPVLGKYVSGCLHRSLSEDLLKKWQFNPDGLDGLKAFAGDGSRGGPERREFTKEEKARL